MEDALAVSNLRCYQCSLKGLAANTVRAAFHPLRGLSEFLIHEAKLLEENPVKAFTMPKKAEGRRLTMSDPEALALLDAAARQCDPRKVAMSVALISALLYTGVRADKLVNIRLADVLFDQEEMLVSKGKGGKKRTLFPTPANATGGKSLRLLCGLCSLYQRRCASSSTRTSSTEAKASRSSSSSRSLPWKLSWTPFCHGQPGSM